MPGSSNERRIHVAPAAPGRDAGLSPAWFAVLLAVVIAAMWPEVLLGSHTFIARDYGYFGYPLAHFHRASFWRGEIPLWNPLNNCGLPFLAQWNTLTLYPGSLLYLLLPLPWSLGVFCLAHLFWGGLGMYLLGRRWTGNALGGTIAGTAFAFNGVLLNSLMWPNNIAALGWMPWVVLATERGWREGGRLLWAAGLVGAMQMLTGGPEVILLTWILLFLFAATARTDPAPPFRRRVSRLVGMAALVGLLSSAQLLPFLDLLHQSQRDEHFFEGAWAMPATGWANLLVPLFGCLKTAQGRFYQWDQYWTSSYYAGVGILALALLAAWKVRRREVWILVGVAVFGLTAALGEHGYVLPLLKRLIPQIGFLRYPIKLVVWLSFCLPLLAAYGLQGLQRAHGMGLWRTASSAVRLAVVLTLMVGALIAFAAVAPQPRERVPDTLLSGTLRAGALWLCLALCLAARNSPSKVLRSLPVFLVAADLLTAVPRLSPTVPSVVLRPDLPGPTPRPEFGLSRAMVTFAAHQQFNTSGAANLADDFLVKRSALFGNANLIDAIPKLDGFYSLYLDRADTVLSALYFQTNHTAVARILASTNLISFAGLHTFLGVSQISADRTNYEWSVRTDFMPLISTGQQAIRTNEAAALAALLRPDFDPRRRAYLPEGSQGSLAADVGEPAQLLVTRFRANGLEATFEARQPSLLVVAQSFHPNWKAFVDDQPAVVLPANVAFQAVQVPAGRHLLVLRYADRGFMAGLLISLSTLLGAVTAQLRRKRKQTGPSMEPGP
jgi:hypothetical protein